MRLFLLFPNFRIHGTGDHRARNFDSPWKGSSPITQDRRMWSFIACISSASPLTWALKGRLKATSPRISRTKYEMVDFRSKTSPVFASLLSLLSKISMWPLIRGSKFWTDACENPWASCRRRREWICSWSTECLVSIEATFYIFIPAPKEIGVKSSKSIIELCLSHLPTSLVDWGNSFTIPEMEMVRTDSDDGAILLV